jgi:hypothetical protein
MSSNRNGNLEVPIYFLKARQFYTYIHIYYIPWIHKLVR